jgi:tRNA(Ile)-lysidine synthase
MTDAPRLQIAAIPEGAWAVGVSGGADSVALLVAVARTCPHVRPHVVHLNHETRGEESDRDERFVTDLATRLGAPYTAARRGELEGRAAPLPANPSARYRALRHALFREVCQSHGLSGVLLAHHADDQAETVLHRLVRGSGLLGLGGMTGDSVVGGGLRVVRPMLGVRRAAIRSWLIAHGQEWREDASNQSNAYLRNRLRGALAGRVDLADALLELGRAAAGVKAWAHDAAPELAQTFRVEQLNALPSVVADVAVRRWLTTCGVPVRDIEPAVVERVVRMAADAGLPGSLNLPGRLIARRRAGTITASLRPTAS